jgi:MFS transporter, FSR family, fosmidomycin resistance protein
VTAPARSFGEDARLVGTVSVAHFASHVFQLTLPSLFPLLREALDVPYVALAFVMTVFYVTSGVAQAAAGFAVDRFGARPILVGGLALFSVGLALAGLAPAYIALLPIALVAGMGNSVFHPADYSLMNSTVDPRRIGRAFSAHGVAGTLGYAIAPATVIALAAHVGWRGALLAMGGAGLAVTLAVTVGLGGAGRVRAPAVGDKATPAGTAAPRLAGDVRLLLTAPIILAFAYFALQAGANLGVTAFSVPALVMIYDVPIIFAASAVTGYLLGSAGGILLGGFLADRARRHDLVAAGGLLATAVILLVVGAGALAPALLPPALLVAGACMGATSPSRDMLVRAASPRGASGKVYGFVYSGFDLGSAVMPLGFGWLLDHGEPRLLFAAVAMVMLVTIPTVVQVRRRAVLAARA